MKILNKTKTILSPQEVYDILTNTETSNDTSVETIKYLIKEYCKNNNINSDVIDVLETMNLFPFEIYQLCQHKPSNLITIQLIVDEMEERYTEEELNNILKLFVV